MYEIESQLTYEETDRLLGAAFGDPACRGTWRLLDAKADKVGRQEMIGRWSVQTPEGPLHRVALVRVLDGETRGYDRYFREEAVARVVFDLLDPDVEDPEPEPAG